MDSREQLFRLLDFVMSEYKWTIDYVLSINIDVLMEFYRAIQERKKAEYILLAKIIALGSNSGFSGKMDNLSNLFNDSLTLTSDDQVAEMRSLWLGLKKDPKEFERQLQSGEIKI